MTNESYQIALQKINLHTKEFKNITLLFREGKINDVEFLNAKKDFNLAEAQFDNIFDEWSNIEDVVEDELIENFQLDLF